MMFRRLTRAEISRLENRVTELLDKNESWKPEELELLECIVNCTPVPARLQNIRLRLSDE